MKNHVGEAHSTSASMKGACESAPVGVMLGNVALVLHFCGMEDFIAKLKQFSKLDFQSKREVINDGRPMPELKGMVQTTGLFSGFCDLKNLPRSLGKHERSGTHI